MLDFAPVTDTLITLVTGVQDDQLTAPTPCDGATVGDLLDHTRGLAAAFTAAARKQPPSGPSADARNLSPDWRTDIPRGLRTLAAAWGEQAAWQGATRAGGPDDLPAGLAAAIAMDELIIHGWDIAVATGQPFAPGPEHVRLAGTFVRPAVEGSPDGSPGLFGPPVPVPASATPFDQLLGLTGRDPAWRAPA
jgi:uncharacterized protein (TIGR03086 family)